MLRKRSIGSREGVLGDNRRKRRKGEIINGKEKKKKGVIFLIVEKDGGWN